MCKQLRLLHGAAGLATMPDGSTVHAHGRMLRCNWLCMPPSAMRPQQAHACMPGMKRAVSTRHCCACCVHGLALDERDLAVANESLKAAACAHDAPTAGFSCCQGCRATLLCCAGGSGSCDCALLLLEVVAALRHPNSPVPVGCPGGGACWNAQKSAAWLSGSCNI